MFKNFWRRNISYSLLRSFLDVTKPSLILNVIFKRPLNLLYVFLNDQQSGVATETAWCIWLRIGNEPVSLNTDRSQTVWFTVVAERRWQWFFTWLHTLMFFKILLMNAMKCFAKIARKAELNKTPGCNSHCWTSTSFVFSQRAEKRNKNKEN